MGKKALTCVKHLGWDSELFRILKMESVKIKRKDGRWFLEGEDWRADVIEGKDIILEYVKMPEAASAYLREKGYGYGPEENIVRLLNEINSLPPQYREIPLAIYMHACPNCGGEIDSIRLFLGVPCQKCLRLKLLEIVNAKSNMDRLSFLRFIDKHIDYSFGDEFRRLLQLEEELSFFEELSKKIIGNRLWSAQRAWVKRLVKGLSFSITAPTGLGKSYFGMLAAIYFGLRGKKTLIVVPTVALVIHTLNKLREYIEKLGEKIAVIGYYTGMKTKEKREYDELLRNRDFHVLVLTSQGLTRRFDQIRDIRFDLIFVDDVDAFLKSSKNIDRALFLLGFKEEHIEKALDIARRRRYLPFMSEEERERFLEEAKKFSEEIEKYRVANNVGQLIVASATGTARGLRILTLRELLNFTVGSSRGGLRNIVDSYYIPEQKEKDVVVKLARILGDGGIIFVYRVREKLINRIVKGLERAGFKVGDTTKKANIAELIDKFSRGEIDILIGSASYYGKLARGLDLPHRVRYAIFVGVPHFRFSLEIDEHSHPMKGFLLLNEVVDFIKDQAKRTQILRLLNEFKRRYLQLDIARRNQVAQAIMEGKDLENMYLQKVKEVCMEVLRAAAELIRDKEIVRELKKSAFVEVEEIEGKLYVLIPDAKTYIQGSGRTSRLYAGGITKGLSVIVTRRKKLLNALMTRTRWFVERIEWYDFKELDLKSILREIDRDREIVKALQRGEIPKEFKELTKSALMIVESPTKARTIARFFGKPARRIRNGTPIYEVTTGDYMLSIVASKGHILDLVLADFDISSLEELRRFFDVDRYLYGVRIVKWNGKRIFIPEFDVISMCVDCGEKFTGVYDKCPRCGSENIVSRYDVIRALRDAAEEVDEILIATDPDIEGEKIGFDIALLLAPYTKEIKRVEYHAVTISEIRRALSNPEKINIRRVEAQLVRRILDRWVGFAYSHTLWMAKNVAGRRATYSAGRVQTPVLGWIIERAKEFRENMTRVVFLELSNGFRIELEAGDMPRSYWSGLKDKNVNVVVKEQKVEEINPPPPYITADVLRDLSNILRTSTMEIMRILQELFESGLITYHRTDSTRVSPEGINIAKEYIKNAFGDLALFQPRTWTRPGEEGTHECIRPTMPITADMIVRMLQTGELIIPIRFTRMHYRAYQRIFSRFIASQMKPSKAEKVKLEIIIDRENGIKTEIEGISQIIEDGFTKILPLHILPDFKEAKIVDVTMARISKAPLYSESEIIEKMKKEGIGRPSTYAQILSTLFRRRYVARSVRKGKVYPLKKGIDAYNTLMRLIENYSKILEKVNKELATGLRDFVRVKGTRELEEEMDRIERGEIDYQKVLNRIYELLGVILKDLKKYYKKVLLPYIAEEIQNSKIKR